MQAFGGGPDISPSFLVQAYPWKELATGTVVDLGGSNGSVGAAIAEAYPDLSIIVQDMPEVVNAAIEQEAQPNSRIRFMAHDFFSEQPVSADLYLFRYIFHNWPDQYAIKILRQLIPALKPGARILVNDHLLPEPNTASLTTEREIR
jgi:SAM-dependent methyltransferase